jgi:hypothetical protein
VYMVNAAVHGSRGQVRRFGGRGMVWVRESQVGVESAKARNATRSKDNGSWVVSKKHEGQEVG